MENNKRSKRGVLLIESEVRGLKAGEIGRKSKQKLISKLDDRLAILFQELPVITTSKVLKPWLEIKKYQYSNQFQKLSDIFGILSDFSPKRIYLDKIEKV